MISRDNGHVSHHYQFSFLIHILSLIVVQSKLRRRFVRRIGASITARLIADPAGAGGSQGASARTRGRVAVHPPVHCPPLAQPQSWGSEDARLGATAGKISLTVDSNRMRVVADGHQSTSKSEASVGRRAITAAHGTAYTLADLAVTEGGGRRSRGLGCYCSQHWHFFCESPHQV